MTTKYYYKYLQTKKSVSAPVFTWFCLCDFLLIWWEEKKILLLFHTVSVNTPLIWEIHAISAYSLKPAEPVLSHEQWFNKCWCPVSLLCSDLFVQRAQCLCWGLQQLHEMQRLVNKEVWRIWLGSAEQEVLQDIAITEWLFQKAAEALCSQRAGSHGPVVLSDSTWIRTHGCIYIGSLYVLLSFCHLVQNVMEKTKAPFTVTGDEERKWALDFKGQSRDQKVSTNLFFLLLLFVLIVHQSTR